MAKLDVQMCKVCILGAAGGAGRHLALLLKLNKFITDIALYDIKNLNGIREDLSHIDSTTRVKAYSGNERTSLIRALKCSSLVVILAGESYSLKYPTRESRFHANAPLMMDFMNATACACHCKMPFIHVVTNPINALVPLCGEYLKQLGCYDKRKLSGTTALDGLRARTFLGEFTNSDPSKLYVPVIGGHSVHSITPLFSQSKPRFEIEPEDQEKLEDRVIYGSAHVIRANKPEVRACQLSLAYCLSKFCDSVCRAIYGGKNISEMGFIPADVNELDYFGCHFTMDHNGIKHCHRLPPMSESEVKLYYRAVADVQENITRAKEFLSQKNRKNLKNIIK